MSIKNFNVKNGLTVGTATITAASGNLAVGNANLGNLATANFFSGAGNALSNIQGANVSGAVASANNATTAGTVTTNAQSNITSVGTLTSLTVSGVSNLGPNSNVIITGGSSGQFLQTNGSGNLSWVTVGTSGISNGTSSVSVPVSNGNILANVNGNIVLTVAELGANITGYANITGNANVGNLGTGGLITATGNITGGNVNTAGAVVASTLTSNVTTGTAPLTVASTTKVTNLNADLLDGYDTATAATANTIVVRNADGNITGNNISGTLSTASQPSITSVGTLSALTVTGNIQTSANLVTDLIVGRTSSVTITATGSNQNVNLTPTGTGTVNVGNFIISNVATPTASTDAATKQYVDDVAQGLNTHASCNAATQTTLATISGGTVTYDNGTDGVGATLTTTGTYTTIDGVTLSNGMRILVKNEVTQANNGIYVRTSATVLTRATDFNTAAEIAGGDFTFVTAGTLYNSTGWVQIDDVVTVGTDPIVWEQFSGAGEYTAGTGLTLTGTQFSITNTTVTAGAYGNGDYNATFTVNAQGQLTAAANVAITANAANLTGTTLAATIVNSSLTSVGTLGALAVTGNATAGNVYANSGTIGASLLTGTLTTAAQPNVTSVGTLSTVNVSGNANVGNLGTGGLIVATGNIDGGNLNTGGALSVTGNANVGNLGTARILATGNITTTQLIANVANGTAPLVINSQTVVANLNADLLDGYNTAVSNTANTVAVRDASGNLSANFFTGNGAFLTGIDTSLIANGNSNVSVAANGNVTINVSGNAGIATFTGTGANIAGYANVTGNLTAGNVSATDVSGTTLGGTLTTAAQPNITSVGTLTSLAVTGNISGGNANLGNLATANFFTGTLTTNAQPNVTSVGTLASLAVTGNVTAGNVTGANLVSANFVAGTLTTAAQPNITSVGSLTSLDVTGNVTAEYIKPVGYSTDRANVSVTTNTVIDQFNPTTFRTAKYVISASGDDGYQSVETLLVHDGVDAYITIYGSVCSNVSADIIDVSANINGVSGNVAVYATTASGNVLVNVVASYIKT
jgi:hypothetical protein